MDKDSIKVFFVSELIRDPSTSRPELTYRLSKNFDIGLHPAERIADEVLFELLEEGVVSLSSNGYEVFLLDPGK